MERNVLKQGFISWKRAFKKIKEDSRKDKKDLRKEEKIQEAPAPWFACLTLVLNAAAHFIRQLPSPSYFTLLPPFLSQLHHKINHMLKYNFITAMVLWPIYCQLNIVQVMPPEKKDPSPPPSPSNSSSPPSPSSSPSSPSHLKRLMDAEALQATVQPCRSNSPKDLNIYCPLFNWCSRIPIYISIILPKKVEVQNILEHFYFNVN